MGTNRRPATWVAMLASAVLLVGACGGDDSDAGSSDQTDPTSEVADGSAADSSDDDSGSAVAAPTGEPRGTVQMNGTEHALAMVDTIAPSCIITESSSSVSGMGSGTHAGVGISVTYGGATDINWRASVTDYDNGGVMWEVAHVGTPGQDVTYEISEGRVVIDGTWGQLSGGATETIRLELICPAS